MRNCIFIGILMMIGSSNLFGQSELYQELNIESSIDWNFALLEKISETEVLILGVGESGVWEFLTYNLSNYSAVSHRTVEQLSTPTALLQQKNRILIGGNLDKDPGIWEYNTESKGIEKLTIDFPTESKLIEFKTHGEELLVLLSSDTSFTLFTIDILNNRSVLQERIAKRAKDDQLKMIENTFGEYYLIQSHQFDPKRYPIILKKYNSKFEVMWEKTVPESPGSIDDLTMTSDGDVAGLGTYTPDIYKNSFLIRWAPNGIIKGLSIQNNQSKFQKGHIGYAKDNLWLINEVVPFGGRMGDIILYQSQPHDLTPISTIQIGEKYHEEILGCNSDERGNAILLFKSGSKKRPQVKLIHYEINPDPCSRILDPNEDFRITLSSSTSFSSQTEQYQFICHVSSREKLTPSSVRIKLLDSGTKAPEQTNMVLVDSASGQYCYRVSKSLYLSPGENKIHILVSNQDSGIEDTISVYHLIDRPNLFIFAVGVVYEDLNFTDKDAADFVSLFSDQEGRLFNQISVELLNTKEQTTAKNINRELDHFIETNQIRDQDMVFVFFSSHGELINEEFVVLASDYEYENPNSVVQFNRQIIGKLKKLKGKKILFLDACKSGNLKGMNDHISPQLISTIFRVVQSAPGIMAISSSSDLQSSYEVKDLQNGVFTAAIKELFGQDRHRFDLNQDQVLTVHELYQYLRNRVPELMEIYFKDPNKQQVPDIPIESMDQDLPIFYLPKGNR